MSQIGRKILSFHFLTWVQLHVMSERERWLIWVPVLLGCGIGWYFSFSFEPPLWSGWLGFSLLLWGAWVLRTKPGLSALIMLSLAIIALGVGLSSLRTWWVAAPQLRYEINFANIEGQIHRLEVRPKGLRVTLDHLHIAQIAPDQTPKTVRLTLSKQQIAFAPGDWIRVRGHLSPPPPPAEPGAFDFQRQSYFKGLGGIGFAFGQAERIGRAQSRGLASLAFSIGRLRALIAQDVRKALPGDTGAVAAALMTGDRGAIAAKILNDMRASGLAHLLAISGLHVGLIAGIVFFTLRIVMALIPSLVLRYPIKKWAAIGAIIGAGGYALLAGATVPTWRAFLMIGLVFLAVLFDRKALSMRSIAWAALVILVMAPESLLGASFQLSFAAVVALIAVYEVLRKSAVFSHKKTSIVRQIGIYILSVALTTLVAGLATSIFAAYHFNRVAEYSLAANIVAVPLTALWIMPWAVISYVVLPFGLEAWPLMVMGWGINGVLAVANAVAHWPGAVRQVSAFPLWGLVLVAFGGLWMAIWCQKWRLWGGAFILLGLMSLGLGQTPDILIDRTGKLAAIRTPTGGYQVSTLRGLKFERGVWLRRSGLNEVDGVWPQKLKIPPKTRRDFITADDYMRCDDLGCIFKKSGQTVALVQKPEAMLEDCVPNQIVIGLNDFGSMPTRCAAKVLITNQDLQAKGAHALYFRGASVRVKTVRHVQGNRPWVIGKIAKHY